MILYLIRHGRSEANERGWVTGTPDDPLSAAGLEQAQALARWWTDLGVQPERLMVSHWRRARETAEILFPQRLAETDRRLGETDAGSVAQLPLTQFLREHPAFYANPANAYPGGESHNDLNHRVLAWLDEQLHQCFDSLCVVAHSGPISCILQHLVGVGMEAFPKFLPTHASLSAIRFQPGRGVDGARLLAFAIGPSSSAKRLFHAEA